MVTCCLLSLAAAVPVFCYMVVWWLSQLCGHSTRAFLPSKHHPLIAATIRQRPKAGLTDQAHSLAEFFHEVYVQGHSSEAKRKRFVVLEGKIRPNKAIVAESN